MDIKKGQKFLCKETVVMNHTGELAYIKGKTYTSERDGCLTDEEGDFVHSWSWDTDFDRYFELIEEETKESLDEGWPIPPDHLIYRTAKFKVGMLVEIKNPKRDHLINPIWTITEAKLNQDTKEWYYEAHITGMTHLRRTFKESEIKLYEEEVPTEIDGNEAEGVTEDLSFQTIADAAVRLLEYKNKHYGNSALNPIEVFNGKTKVGQRADDKLSRIKNHPTLRKADVIDLLGYLILMCKENGWSDFSEFED